MFDFLEKYYPLYVSGTMQTIVISIVGVLLGLIYNGLWFSPLMNAIKAFIIETQKVVNGNVRVKLFKGNAICEGRKSINSLYDKNLATYTSADEFDQEAANGFIKLWELPDKVYAQVHAKKKRKSKQANLAKNSDEVLNSGN